MGLLQILKDDPEAIIEEVYNWSERKRQTFKAQHIHMAWVHLNDLGLFEEKVSV
ncbi:hypothetical protein LC040_06245 [Bacillus tianshenii]|nr:hypothetical protein LC040_06245 [Bacillus tianshenii]